MLKLLKNDYKIGDLFKLIKSPYSHPDWDYAIMILYKIDKEKKYNGDWLYLKCFFNSGFIADHKFIKSDVRKLC